MRGKVELGDWQTPVELARQAVARLGLREAPETVLEPTCGDGAFLVAAAEAFPRAALVGFDLEARRVRNARRAVPNARIERGDFFATSWRGVVAELEGPLLVLGNPPWVTSATLGALGSRNVPTKSNWKRLGGNGARTGASNFDVSEWMIFALLDALGARRARATLAVLCKVGVARRIVCALERAESRPPSSSPWSPSSPSSRARPGALVRIDAARHFDAAVDAALFVVEIDAAAEPCARGEGRGARAWPVFASLEAREPETRIAVHDGVLVADAASHARTAHLAGACRPEWRSGMKHDCARVMELEERAGAWTNGLGEVVDIEEDVLYPLLKSSDVANGRLSVASRRAVVVPQRALGDETALLPPRARAYLESHRALFEARKSSVYVGRPPFAVFGVGPYSFAPWKVAVSGLYKRLAFAVVGPERRMGGRPVMLDDTCYFLPFDDEDAARRAASALASPLAEAWFRARVFWSDKRPIRKSVLQALDLERLTSLTSHTSLTSLTRRRDRNRRSDPRPTRGRS